MPARQRLVLAASIGAVTAFSAFAASLTSSSVPTKTVPAVAAAIDAGAPELAVASAPSAPSPSASPADLAQLDVPSRLHSPPIATMESLPKAADLLAQAWLDGEGHLAVGSKDAPRELTVLPALQRKLSDILASYETPYAAVVVMEPSTGKVLAMAEHSGARPSLRGLAVKAVFPAASIFKLVTASALLEAGLSPGDTECAPFAKRKIVAGSLKDSARGQQCFSLSHALALSRNAIFAKLTARHLTPAKLLEWAERFHFNRPLDFEEPAEASLAAVPEAPLAFASTGAGFGDVFLSPLHGAAIAAAIANRGLWREPVLVEGDPVPEPSRIMSVRHARELAGMMEDTVTLGTARRIFHERGYRVPGAVGKTGSLADKKPFRDYSWFVGFAPRDNPQVSVAAVIVNEPRWRIRATWLAREAMRLGLELREKSGTDVAASR